MVKGQTKCPICGRFVSRGLAEKYDLLKVELEQLKKSNDFLEKRIDHHLETIAALEKDKEDLQREVGYFKNRGFWQRLFNI